MQKFFMMTLALLWVLPNLAHADRGLVNVESQHDASTTADRFVAAVEQAGLKVFSRIDHAAGAAQVGETLRPTQLIIFGSPKVGTALMNADQRVGIDLPLKALIWQDEEGKVWVSYNSPDYLFGRFSIEGRDPVKQKITQALGKFAAAAAE
ncbi:MAG: DUF302 domain-containing protein [Candidatus Thiodiazotropha sp.]|jgi:uncharacterized protein (DUF302 family)